MNYSPNHPEFILHPEMADEAFANTGGSCVPKKSFFKRNDDEKRWLENIRLDDDAWYDHLQREAEFQQQLHNNLY